MGRILAIDYGSKRCGIACSDPLKIIGSPLTTVPTDELINYLEKYLRTEEVECLVIGEPKRFNGQPSEIEADIQTFIQKLHNATPTLKVVRFDERFTSVLASRALYASGLKKKQRQDKNLLDSSSAALILQDYLNTLT